MTTKCSEYQLEIETNKTRNAEDEPLTNIINSIFDNSKDAVFGVDAGGNIGYLNKNCRELFGFPENGSIAGQHCSDLLCGGDDKCASTCCTECAINHNMESEQQINDYELSIKQANGTQLKVNVGTCYFYQKDDKEVSTYFSLREVKEVEEV
ncbi:MAG: PAS domain-containing protein [Gammaproteobacteria bacterium]|nr:PAS domain-containing protein [Gammaproteobacteria bacterium]